MPIAITTISKKSYKSLLKDAEDIGAMPEKYGAGWILRLHGVGCAVAVHQCAKDAKAERVPFKTAEDLYNLVYEYGYDTIFEDNHIEEYKPPKTIMECTIFACCQAETGDYGEE